MIKNDQQLAQAEAKASRLRDALRVENLPQQISVVVAELERTEREIEAYVDVREGRRKRFEIDDINDLADVLVLARISRGLTQEQLADELGVRQQQIAKDENGGYHAAGLTKISDVLDILDYDVVAQITPADRTPIQEIWFEESEGTTARPSAFNLIRSSANVAKAVVDTQPDRQPGVRIEKKRRVLA